MFIEDFRFPDGIAYGATGGPQFSTTVTQVLSGDTKLISQWKNPLYRFEVSFGVKDQDQLDELLDFFYETKGQANAFRFKNYQDFQINQTKGCFNNIDGEYKGEKIIRLYKVYALTAIRKSYRRIQKPVPGTFKLFCNGILYTAYTIDYATGKVTLTTPLESISIISINKDSNALIQTSTPHSFINGDKVNFTDIAGMTQMNGLSGVVEVISADSFSVDINSSNFSDYTSSGTASKYFELGDNITFECEFDVPCRFGKDDMMTSIDNFEIYSWNQIPVLEIRLKD